MFFLAAPEELAGVRANRSARSAVISHPSTIDSAVSPGHSDIRNNRLDWRTATSPIPGRPGDDANLHAGQRLADGVRAKGLEVVDGVMAGLLR